MHGLEPGPELGEIALHLLEAGRPEDRDRAVDLAERAADWALERDAYEQAVTLLTRALAVLTDADVEERRRLTRRRASRVRAADARAVRRRELGLRAATRRRTSAGVTSSTIS